MTLIRSYRSLWVMVGVRGNDEGARSCRSADTAIRSSRAKSLRAMDNPFLPGARQEWLFNAYLIHRYNLPPIFQPEGTMSLWHHYGRWTSIQLRISGKQHSSHWFNGNGKRWLPLQQAQERWAYLTSTRIRLICLQGTSTTLVSQRAIGFTHKNRCSLKLLPNSICWVLSSNYRQLLMRLRIEHSSFLRGA